MAPDGTASKNVDVPLASNQTIADTLQIVSTALFGLTIHCAQCHNHRYDPIPQSDYYRLRAIFEPALDWKSWRAPAAREIVVLSEADRTKADQIEKQAGKIDQERFKKEAEYIEQTFRRELAKVPKEVHEAARRARKTPAAKRSAADQKLLRDYPNLNVTAGSLYLYDAKAAAALKTYLAKAAALRATKPTGQSIRALTEIPGKVPTTFLFHRGDHEQPKEAVAPAGLTILEPFQLGPIPHAVDGTRSVPTTSGRRLAFARTLTNGKHPLVARVLVNRVWMHHFGKGIVATPGDFGFLGDRPTHPELLDWLAGEFMRGESEGRGTRDEGRGARDEGRGARDDGRGAWRLKRLHKLLMTSTAYRQASGRSAALVKIDPDNHLLGRMSLRRLEAEALRDAVLAVSGALNPKQFGPPVPIMFDDLGQIVVGVDTTDTAGRPTGKVVPLQGEEYRRSLYVQTRRSRPLAVLESFDAPILNPNCEIRHASTATPQALLLMNSRFIHEQAEFFAGRVVKEAGTEKPAQIKQAWRLAYGCEPSIKEMKESLAFVNEQTAHFRGRPKGRLEPEMQALANFCQALLSANSFLYVD